MSSLHTLIEALSNNEKGYVNLKNRSFFFLDLERRFFLGENIGENFGI